MFFGIALALLIITRSVSAQSDDTTPPTSSHTLNPSVADGENGWYKRPVNVTISASDLDSGVASIHWKIGDYPWQEKAFSQTLNLLQDKNPSFELGNGSTIDKWESFGTAGAAFTHDNAEHYDGAYSAKITNTVSEWSGWNNQTAYVPNVDFGDNMSASVRVKTDNIVGAGAYFTIYAFTCSGESLPIKDSETKITGTTADWVIISEKFIASVTDICGVYLDIGLNGTGTVWIDNAALIEGIEDTSTDFIISKNDSFNLEYYSIDRDGNEELPHHSVPLKIDTRAPGNWRDFETEVIPREGNDHTLVARIRVSDQTSGLQANTDKFQYSVDAGMAWGYFEDLLHCDPNAWHEGGWLSLVPSFTSGANEALLVTPQVDYCNSDWKICKTIRFRIKDIAGNENQKDICINGAWSQTSGQGDVYAQNGINFSASGAGDNTDGVIISGGSIVNFTSSQGWNVPNYTLNFTKDSYTYTKWQEKLPQQILLTGGLPTTDGVFMINGDFTIEKRTIPSDLQTATFEAVIFVNRNLMINSNYYLGSQGALVFIIYGDVVVAKGVENIAGMFFVDNNFSTGGGNSALNIQGSVLADSIELDRSLSKQDNSNNPAELFTYEPKYLELMRDLLSEKQRAIRWFEVGL